MQNLRRRCQWVTAPALADTDRRAREIGDWAKSTSDVVGASVVASNIRSVIFVCVQESKKDLSLIWRKIIKCLLCTLCNVFGFVK